MTTKWSSKTYYVDTETGEIIKKNLILNKEYKINKTIKTILKYDTYTIIERTNECSRQQRAIWE